MGAFIFHSLPFFIVIFSSLHISRCQLSQDRNELLNWCLKSIDHKSKPGKESSLYAQCQPWSEHACCTSQTTYFLHQETINNFTYDACSEQLQRNMSDKCQRHFVQDHCFYNCEPNIGLWVVQTNRKLSKERFYNVPLCASDCISWFEDCKEDFTCAYNWPRDFQFSNGRNSCKRESQCIPFKMMYEDAREFCENVYDGSWKYTPDDEPCMHIWFDGASGNPNRRVAEHYIDAYLAADPVKTNGCATFQSHYLYIMLFVVVSYFLC